MGTSPKSNEDDTNSRVVPMAKIHSTAIIPAGAEIGRNVEIGPYTTLGENVTIGEDTVIGPHVVIKGKTVIGKNNEIFHGTSIGGGSEEDGEKKDIIIGDNNTIRENVTIHSGGGAGTSSTTRVGDDNFIMAYCYIGSNSEVGSNIIITNASHLASEVIVEDQAVIAGLTEIEAGVRIGKIAMIGAHSRVTKDVPPYIMADGHPARVKNINVIGLRRNGFKPSLRKEIKKMFKILYQSDLDLKSAAAKMEREIESCAEIDHFLKFIRSCKKGISR